MKRHSWQINLAIAVALFYHRKDGTLFKNHSRLKKGYPTKLHKEDAKEVIDPLSI